MIGRRLLFSLELGHEVQPLCDTLPIGRIGFAEMPDLAELDRFGHILHGGGDIIGQRSAPDHPCSARAVL